MLVNIQAVNVSVYQAYLIVNQRFQYVSLHRRQYPGGEILTEGKRCGGHRAEVTGTVTRKFTQLRTTCARARPTAACLGLSGRLARDYNDCAYSSKALGVPVYIA